jgi:3-ketosteroid 9alpha-monooxygenase subunit A
MNYTHGWFQLAFEDELEPIFTPLQFAGRSLMAVRNPETGVTRVFDAVCPHRGADLAHGGRLAGEAVICPFHSYRIGLGCSSADGFAVPEYPALVAAAGLFARLSDRDTPDFPGALADMTKDHHVVKGFTMQATTSVEVVIENGFDSAHFRSVHGLMNLPSLEVSTGRFGELLGDGNFEIPRSGWYESANAGPKLTTHYLAHAYSPGVFISELDGDPPFRYRIMTSATPAENGRVTIRLTLLLPEQPGQPLDRRFADELLAYSRDGLDKDCAIWNRLDLTRVPRFTARDQPARAFADFCRTFREA